MRNVILNWKDILLNPRRMNAYTPLFSWVDSSSASKSKLPFNHPFPAFHILILYLVFILPLSLSLLLAGFPIGKLLVVTSTLIAIGLLAGSLHASFGLVVVLGGVIVTALNGRLLTAPDVVMKLLWSPLFMVFIPLGIYAHKLAHQSRFWPKVARLAVGLLVGGIGLYLVQMINGSITITHYVITVIMVSYALSAPLGGVNSSEDGFDLLNGFAAAIFVISLAYLGYLQSLAWFAALHIVWRVLLTILMIIAGFILGVAVIGIPLGIMDGFDFSQNIRYADVRWFVLLLYLALQVIHGPKIAILATLVGFLLYGLSFVSFINPPAKESFGAHILTAFFSGVVWACMIDGYLTIPAWLPNVRAIITPSFALPVSWVIFILFIFFYFLSNDFSIALLGLIAGSIILLIGSGAGLLDYVIIVAGIFLGLSKILNWPVISFVIYQEIRRIKKNTDLTDENRQLAIELLENPGLLRPSLSGDLLLELMRRGVSAKELKSNSRNSNLIKQVQAKIAEEFFKTNFTISDLGTKNLEGVPALLAQNIKTLLSCTDPKIPVYEKVHICAVVVDSLQTATVEKDDVKKRTDLSEQDKKAVDKIIALALDEARPHVAESAFFYDLLNRIASHSNIPPIPESDKTDLSLENLEMVSRDTANKVLELSKQLKEIEPFLEKLPQSDRQIYQALNNASTIFRRFSTAGVDYPSRQRSLQLAIEELEKVRLAVNTSRLTINTDIDEAISVPNEWPLVVNLLSSYLEILSNITNSQLVHVRTGIITLLSGTSSLEDLAMLGSQLKKFSGLGQKYGSVLDEVVGRLDLLSQEASSTLLLPKGYNRRLGTQETLDRVNELRGLLSTNYITETSDIMKPLDSLAKAIYDSLYEVSDEKVVGFRNPYITGNPIKLSRSALFKGRLDIVEKMLIALRSGSNPTFVLHGPRRMGKTSFLLQLQRLLPAEFYPVFIDMQEGAAQSDAQFLFSLANAIYRQLRRESSLSVEKPELSVFEARPLVAITNWLDELQPQLGKRSLFFTVDEFEAIGRALENGTLTIQILEYLRHMMQHNENMILLFAGVQTIDALGPSASSYFISAYPIEISYLAREDAVELILRPDPSAGEMPAYDADVVDQIVFITHNQPYLIQAVCSELISIVNSTGADRITMPVLDDAITRVLSTSLYFKNIWEDARAEGQAILRALSSDNKPEFTAMDKPALELLIKRHVIVKTGNQTFEIEIPLVSRWIRNQEELH